MIKVKSLEIREIEYSYDKRPKISGMDDVIKAVKPMIADPNKEFFIALFLNTKNGIIKQEIISIGSLSAMSSTPGKYSGLHAWFQLRASS